MNMKENKMFQVATLQALMMGYTRKVMTVEELLRHGDIGLGTFEDVNGEMIVLDGHCYRAANDGSVVEAAPETGVPFASVECFHADRSFIIEQVKDIDALKDILNVKIEEGFGLNSMHVVRIDGMFEKVSARSEVAYRSAHVELKDILAETQEEFLFENIRGTMVCLYYPDYMDGINASGWHFHFVSEDRKQGGHVFEVKLQSGEAFLDKISGIEIQVPTDPAFDTYSLKMAQNDDIKQVEQGK